MDWLLEQEPGSKSLIVAFTSYGEDDAPPTEHEWRGVLSTVPCHKLFLLDRHQHWYHSGVEGFSRDLAGTASRIRDLSAQLSVRRIMTLGSSMAGYAALRVGGMVQAEHVLALSSWTTISAEWRLDRGVVHRERKVREAQHAAGVDHTDVVQQFVEGRKPKSIRVVYDPENLHDNLQVRRLFKTSRLEVCFDPRPGAGHLVGFDMARTGEITRMARSWLGSEAIAKTSNPEGASWVIGAPRKVEDSYAR